MFRDPLFENNPYRVSGVPNTSAMNRMNRMQGFRTVSMPDFRSSVQSRAMQNLRGSLPQGSRSGNPFLDTQTTMYGSPLAMRRPGPDPDMVGGVPFGEDRQPGRLERLLTGGSGAAIGGIAQAGANVLGSYLDRRVEREKLQEERRVRERREKQEDEMRALLDPLFREQLERVRRRQQEMDEQRAFG